MLMTEISRVWFFIYVSIDIAHMTSQLQGRWYCAYDIHVMILRVLFLNHKGLDIARMSSQLWTHQVICLLVRNDFKWREIRMNECFLIACTTQGKSHERGFLIDFTNRNKNWGKRKNLEDDNNLDRKEDDGYNYNYYNND